MGGRLVVLDLLFDSRFRILLPSSNHIAFLIVNCNDVEEGHASVMHTLASVRERFRVLKGVSCVLTVIKKCRVCCIAFAKPEFQVMSPLTRCRVTPGKPAFKCVGVDITGGFMIENGRKRTKRNLCVFTCMAIHAVHLKVVFGLDTDSFLLTSTRFTSRRFKPESMHSDRDTNFEGAEWELRERMKRWTSHYVQFKLLE